MEQFVELNGHARVLQSYKVDGYDLGSWVGFQRAFHSRDTLEADRQHRLEELPGWAWDPHADDWEEGFRRLQEYVKDHGDARVSQRYKVDGYNLGTWVNKQRSLKSRDTLEADRQRRLQDLPGWTWDPFADDWEEGFRRLQEYIERHGHARVGSSYKVDGYKLGTWVSKQRALKSRDTLEADRQHRLQDLPGWAWDARAAKWEERFSRLQDYVKDHGDARVSQSYKVDGHALGRFVSKQRSLHSRDALEADRQQRLQELPGWTWDPHADQWEEGFRRLKEYVEDHGDARVGYSYKVDGYRLGSWVSIQRSDCAKDTLEADRQQRLQDLPGWTGDPKDDQWEEGFSRLQDYVEHNGHARVRATYKVDGYGLGGWVTHQRSVYSKGTLEADSQRRLEELPGWTWDPIGDQWEEGFSRLQDYVEHNGHARVRATYKVDGYRLGGWVGKQRTGYAKGTLDPDRAERLKGLPGWALTASAAKWEEGFRRLQDYVERHGHARVPDSCTLDGYRLGGWVAKQRAKYAKGKLDTNHEHRLQELPGWAWDARSGAAGAAARL